jgi:hypothetical protein
VFPEDEPTLSLARDVLGITTAGRRADLRRAYIARMRELEAIAKERGDAAVLTERCLVQSSYELLCRNGTVPGALPRPTDAV